MMNDKLSFVPALGYAGLTNAYDRVIAVMTRERRWRTALLHLIAPHDGDVIVDIGTGTGRGLMMTMPQAELFLSGVLTAGYWTAALFFVRYWRRSHDRLFVMFAMAFFLLGVQRIALAGISSIVSMHDALLWPYLVRLAAFSAILWGVIEKNRET